MTIQGRDLAGQARHAVEDALYAKTHPNAPKPLGEDQGRDRGRQRAGIVFWALCLAATMLGVVALLVLLTDVLMDGLGHVDGQFLTSYASRFPERAGIKAPLFGTF